MTAKHPKEITVYVRIDSELKKKMQKVAKDLGIGVSTLLRLWAIEKLKTYEEQNKNRKT